MTEKDIVKMLICKGWVCGRDEVGDFYCIFDNDGVQIQAIPTVKRYSGIHQISLMASVSSKEFSEAVSYIFGKKQEYVPVVVNSGPPEKKTDVIEEDLEALIEQAISWAKKQDLQKGLKAYRELPTTAKGGRPLRHLAALALAGDMDRLENYMVSFKQGNRLDFVPYVSLEMIERAFYLAEKYRASP